MHRRIGMLSLALIALALAATGCARKEFIKFDLRHSYSLGAPLPDWPGDPEKTLTPAQQEILEKRGAPSYIRFWWDDDPNFQHTASPNRMEREDIQATRQSWVYLRPGGGAGDEVIFDTPYSSESVPISDKLRIVIKEGDPEERRFRQHPDTGAFEEIWQYYSSGNTYHFQNDALIEVRRLPALGPYLKG